MILLDTNVISEPMKPAPHPSVGAWLDRQEPATLFLSAISVAEIRYGIALLPAGRKQRSLSEQFETAVLPQFAGRVLPFDEAASLRYASLRASATRQGVTLSDFDALIASVAASNDLSVATRDRTPFLAAGVPVIDPFAA